MGHTEDASMKIVQQNLTLLEYGSRIPTQVPLLTMQNGLQCICWALEHIGLVLGDLKKVAWSDESQFQLVRVDVRVWVWRRPHGTMGPSCQQGLLQADGVLIMVWAILNGIDWVHWPDTLYWTHPWPETFMFSYLETINIHSWTSCIQKTMEFSRMTMNHVIGVKSFAIGLRNILDNSSEFPGHLDSQTWFPRNMYVTWSIDQLSTKY